MSTNGKAKSNPETSQEKQIAGSEEKQTSISMKTQTSISMKTRTGTPKRPNVRRIAVIGILSALSMALSLIPQIGYITIPGLPAQITTVHIPVIVAGIVEGPIVGLFVGLIFGLSSIYQALTSGSLIAFAFLNPLVSVLPRILIGVVSWYAYRGMNFVFRNRLQSVSMGVAAVAGSLTNTIGVLGMIYIFYAARFLAAIGLENVSPFMAIGTIAITNAPPEIIAAVLLTIPVALAVKRMKGNGVAS